MRLCRLLFVALLTSVISAVFVYQYTFQLPKEVTIATGSKWGAYYHFAKLYKEEFKEFGIELKIVNTAGSVEALKLLDEDKVDIAFVQGGTADKYKDKGFISLASLFYEPLWVFHNGKEDIKYLNELKGKKISIGKVGSGSHAMFETILDQNGIDKKDILNLGTKEAIESLKNGSIDVFCVVISPQAPIIADLIKNKDIKLVSFQREVAYKDRYDYINSLTLSEGVIDLSTNTPSKDIKLLGTTASLVTKDSLNSDLQRLTMKLIKPIHKDGGIFEPKDYFPSINFVQLPISEHTENYLLKGDSWMEQYLPFWLSSLIENLLILAIPLIPLLIIYSKVILPSYIFRLDHKIYNYNEELRYIEREIDKRELPKEEILEKLLITKKRITRNCLLYFLKTYVFYALVIRLNSLEDTINNIDNEELDHDRLIAEEEETAKDRVKQEA